MGSGDNYNKMGGAGGGGGGSPLDGQIDWGANGGQCYECWKVDPCCDGYCCITWYCCGCFNACKMYSWSLDQQCAIVNHCLPYTFCSSCFMCSMRNAIRRKAGIAGGGPMNGFIGDCLTAYCCGACAMCQEIRAAHTLGGKGSWDFFGNPKPEVMVEPFKFPPFME